MTASCGTAPRATGTTCGAPGHRQSPPYPLVRRNLHDPSADLAFFYCYVPEGRPACFTTLIRVACHR